MKYTEIKEGIFRGRPNRFIAEVSVDGDDKICHVKNTGRCRELLVDGARVLLDRPISANRRTEYDLVAVYKGDLLINMDSQAPNKVFGEWVADSGFFENITLIKPEYAYGRSRFDFYIEANGRRILAEIKGVTLEKDGVALFPDAPTERGVKHICELEEALDKGFEAYVFFIIQMKGCRLFTPNKEMHPELAHALRRAAERGVRVLALDCTVREDGLEIDGPVPVEL